MTISSVARFIERNFTPFSFNEVVEKQPGQEKLHASVTTMRKAVILGANDSCSGGSGVLIAEIIPDESKSL